MEASILGVEIVGFDLAWMVTDGSVHLSEKIN